MASRKSSRKSRKQAPVATWVWGVLAATIVLAVAAFVLLQQNGGVASKNYPPEVSAATAAQKRDAGAFILDVREPDEWNTVHISGATLIPLGELQSRLNEVPKDQEVVVVCRSGNRSATGRDILRQAGFEQVTSMAGGMNQWQALGFPTISGP